MDAKAKPHGWVDADLSGIKANHRQADSDTHQARIHTTQAAVGLKDYGLVAMA